MTAIATIEQSKTGEEPKVRGFASVDRPVISLQRRTVDKILVAAGIVAVVVLVLAGGLLTWGSRFASEHVGDELAAQRVFFPSAEALKTEGRSDLLDRAGTQVLDGQGAKAYASYIKHHLDGIASGQTYADLGAPERAAQAALKSAQASGAPAAQINELKQKADGITTQRDTLFKGETLRGLLLSTYAWATVGGIAGIAATSAFAAAAVLLLLVVLGTWHWKRAFGAAPRK